MTIDEHWTCTVMLKGDTMILSKSETMVHEPINEYGLLG